MKLSNLCLILYSRYSVLGIDAGTQGTGTEQSTKVEWTKVPQQGPKVKVKHSKEVKGGLPHPTVDG
jgi:hypothetical protein